jgi:predicted  nucleic acid-binding Zn-ribbon protein
MSDRVSIDRKEFQAFVAENQELVNRYQELLDKLNSLREINKDLQEKLDLAERRLDSLEKKVGVEVQAGDDRLRKARSTMARLEKETERQLSEPGS